MLSMLNNINADSRNSQSSFNTFLLIIILLASALRVASLATVPNGFYHDEAVNGYEAYSIIKTYRDQYGSFLPLTFRALDDYRESPYIYLTAIFIRFFGLNEFATRLPAAATGILTVLVFYYLVREYSHTRMALISAFLLAINPWLVLNNRIAFRANLLPLLFCLSLFLFAKSFKQPKYLVISFLLFGISLHTYAAARGFVLVFVIGLCLIYRKHLWNHWKIALTGLSLFALITGFLALNVWLAPGGMQRAEAVGFAATLRQFVFQYVTYFSPKSLFITGEGGRSSLEGIGQLYHVEAITVLGGVFCMLKNGRQEKLHAVSFLWLLLYPFPAAAVSQFSSVRAIIGAPIFVIFSAYGLVNILSYCKSNARILQFAFAFIITVNFSLFYRYYFIDSPRKDAAEWQYGMRDTINYIENSNSNCAIVSHRLRRFNYFILFYSHYDPAVYQALPIDPSERQYSLDKYSIVRIADPEILQKHVQGNAQCLAVVFPEDIYRIKVSGYGVREAKMIRDFLNNEMIAILELQKT